MLAPISWLSDYVEIKLPLKELMWKMTEAGLTCESYTKIEGEIVLDVEVTANRPDWMSIVGIARELAAIQGISIKFPKIPELPKPAKKLPMRFVTDFSLFERWSAVTISGITIKPSPDWLQKRLRSVNLRPINNIVDVTNFVMYELGIPMHAFDYDKIKGQTMTVTKASGGEEFTTVDELSYKLPKDAMIIKDSERIIDLVGIKGGINSGISQSTKNILVHVTIDNPVLIRRASQALGLRSDASAIYERGPDKGGTVQTLKRMVDLVRQLAGGEIASEITDLKNKDFKPEKISLNKETMNKVLGIDIAVKDAVNILRKLNLSPSLSKNIISCVIPTYRADIKAEEDLIEEVARIYGYNKFPKTLPVGSTSTAKIPYFFDDSFHLKVKNMLSGFGFDEVVTLSLVSRETIEKCNLDAANHIRIANPVSLDYEFLRTSLIPNLLAAVKINPDENKLKLFELGKVYQGKPGNTQEPYKLAFITKGYNFREFKGLIDSFLLRLKVDAVKIEFETYSNLWHPAKSGTLIIGKEELGTFGLIHPEVCHNLEIDSDIYGFEIDIEVLLKNIAVPVFKPATLFPPQIEDITFQFPDKTRIGDVVDEIKSGNKSIVNAELKDIYGDSYTFTVWYQDPNRTLTNEEVAKIRKSLLQSVKAKFGGTIKE